MGRNGQVTASLPLLLFLLAIAGCVTPDGTSLVAPPTDATAEATVRCALDAVEPFAQVPMPSRPLGLAVHEGITYVATGANFHNRPTDGAQRVFSFGPDGTLIGDVAVEMVPGATMGLTDLAVDSSADGDRLYMVDMMGRVLRSRLGPSPGEIGEPETYATIPPPSGESSMPVQMAFDQDGNVFVTDDFGRVWKIPPGGSPSVWFESPRLQGPVLAGPSGLGAYGARIGPDGKLYLSVGWSGQPANLLAGFVFRIPIGAHPQDGDLEEVARFDPAPPAGDAFPTGIAFGASGRLYVSLTDRNGIAVIGPDGTLDRTISSPLFASPYGIAFLGDELLVTNAGEPPVAAAEAGTVARVCVQEAGLPLNVPAGIP